MYKYLLLGLFSLSLPLYANDEIIKSDCVGEAILAKATIEAKQRGTSAEEFKDYLLNLLLDTKPDELLHDALPNTIHRVNVLYNTYTKPTDAYVDVFKACVNNTQGK